jgi:hypothetical protein
MCGCQCRVFRKIAIAKGGMFLQLSLSRTFHTISSLLFFQRIHSDNWFFIRELSKHRMEWNIRVPSSAGTVARPTSISRRLHISEIKVADKRGDDSLQKKSVGMNVEVASTTNLGHHFLKICCSSYGVFLREHVDGLRVNSTEGLNVKQSLKNKMRGRPICAAGRRTRGCDFQKWNTRISRPWQCSTVTHSVLFSLRHACKKRCETQV